MSVRLELDVSDDQARAFLDALAHDPGFREDLLASPVEKLSEYGITVDPEAIPEEIELPEPDDIDEIIAKIGPRGFTHSSCLVWGLIAYLCAREGEITEA